MQEELRAFLTSGRWSTWSNLDLRMALQTTKHSAPLSLSTLVARPLHATKRRKHRTWSTVTVKWATSSLHCPGTGLLGGNDAVELRRVGSRIKVRRLNQGNN